MDTNMSKTSVEDSSKEKSNKSLKPNDFRLMLNNCKNDHVNKAVKYYCANVSGDDERNRYNQLAINQKFKSRERKLLSSHVLTDGKYVYYYKDTKININVILYKDTPLAFDGWTGFHEEIELVVKDTNNTLEQNKSLVDEFINDASTHFSDKWLDKEDEESKVTVYIWDDYWETLEKSSNRKLSTIYLDGKEQDVYKQIIDFRSPEKEKLYKEFGIPYKYNIMFHGVPGTGKTSLVFSLASELKMNVAIMTFTNEMNDTTLMRCFRRIPENCILVIEDIDTLFQSRKKNDELKNNITFSGLLNTTDGIAYVDKQIIIMTTNYPLNLDPALKRPGRIDMSLEFKYSTKKQISQMFHKFLPKQKERFKEFYNMVKHLKLTSAMLQHFFFGNMEKDNIMDHIDELETIVNENQYESKKHLYT
tara:strand:- start:3113 stop:4369 length:1257 start_codon:yes stop_codon:yes gene_type:complete